MTVLTPNLRIFVDGCIIKYLIFIMIKKVIYYSFAPMYAFLWKKIDDKCLATLKNKVFIILLNCNTCSSIVYLQY